MRTRNVEMHRTVLDVPGDRWDGLTSGAEFHLSRGWLAAMERHREGRPWYVTVEGGGGLLGGAVGHETRDSADSDRDSLNRLTRIDHLIGASLPAGAEAPLHRIMPSVACGGWTLVNSTVLLDRGLDPAGRRAVTEDLLRGLSSAAESSGARSLGFPYVEERNQELCDLLEEHGFVGFPVGPHSALEIGWDSFEGYLGHLKSDRRRKVRRELARLADIGVTCRVVPLDDELVELLWPLGAATVERNSGFVAADQIRARLRILRECDCEVILLEHDGAVRGFGVVAQWKDQLNARMVGFDYDSAAAGAPLYFGLMYEQIKLAVSRGSRVIEYATTTDRAKLARGARSLPQRGYIKAFDPADAALLTGLLRS